MEGFCWRVFFGGGFSSWRVAVLHARTSDSIWAFPFSLPITFFLRGFSSCRRYRCLPFPNVSISMVVGNPRDALFRWPFGIHAPPIPFGRFCILSQSHFFLSAQGSKSSNWRSNYFLLVFPPLNLCFCIKKVQCFSLQMLATPGQNQSLFAFSLCVERGGGSPV